MTKPEMYRRIKTMTREQFNLVRQMIREGYGASGIVNESTATLKQVNAVFEWVDTYTMLGGAVILPQDDQFANA